MGPENKKVLLLSTIRDILESRGWTLYQSFNNEYIFKNAADEILALPQHPKKPRLVYLDEILKRTRVYRREFIEAARREWDLAGDESLYPYVQFDMGLDPGDADISDIQNLFSSLSDLNRAAGGFGIALQKFEAVVS